MLFLAQTVPKVSMELWTLLLGNGVTGILLAVLLILLPFVLGLFWMIIRQQAKFSERLLDGVKDALKNVGDNLSERLDTLGENLSDRLDTQTQLLTIFIQNSVSRNAKEQILQVITQEKHKNGHSSSTRKNVEQIK